MSNVLKNANGDYILTEKQYASFLLTELYAEGLGNGGVDNWSWYSESLQEVGYWDTAELTAAEIIEKLG